MKRASETEFVHLLKTEALPPNVFWAESKTMDGFLWKSEFSRKSQTLILPVDVVYKKTVPWVWLNLAEVICSWDCLLRSKSTILKILSFDRLRLNRLMQESSAARKFSLSADWDKELVVDKEPAHCHYHLKLVAYGLLLPWHLVATKDAIVEEWRFASWCRFVCAWFHYHLSRR